MKHTLSLLAALLLAAMLCAGCTGNAPAEETGTAAADTTVTVPEDTQNAFEAEIDFSDLP